MDAAGLTVRMPVFSLASNRSLNLALPAALGVHFPVPATHSWMSTRSTTSSGTTTVTWLDAASDGIGPGSGALPRRRPCTGDGSPQGTSPRPGNRVLRLRRGTGRPGRAGQDGQDLTSDCIDPLERLDNQAYTGLLVPYELLGAHIGGPASHSTRRSLSLDFRAATALFGHYGIEWDISGSHRRNGRCAAGWTSTRRTGPSSTPA